MEWLLKKIEFDGLPLHLRLPNYENIWKFKNEYPELICVTHVFESVMDNGLPTAEYNESLIDFDGEIIEKFQTENNGIIFLVETFGGARRYWFYGKNLNSFSNIFEILKGKYSDKELELDIQNDDDWGFLKEYPVELY
jgi:hypothetical protein